MLDVEPSKQVN